ncbi:uncharacterized protein IAS62_004975 [Cryptococcus decagattii]|uniref:Uncharacterized protein n=1 Tax=Cryptococcus decagattii TaxID=1859122 RepID=A0ABZ2AYJ4_9TREE
MEACPERRLPHLLLPHPRSFDLIPRFCLISIFHESLDAYYPFYVYFCACVIRHSFDFFRIPRTPISQRLLRPRRYFRLRLGRRAHSVIRQCNVRST